MAYRFHILGLPHTRTSKEFSACAYTQKVFNFCKMMTSLGHEVYHYGAEGSDPPCTEHISVITTEEQSRFFGGCDWRKRTFSADFSSTLPYWKILNHRAIAGIISRKQRGDFLCLSMGTSHQPVVDGVGEEDVIAVETGIGYYGVCTKYKVFESYTHQAAVYGMNSSSPEASLYDAVIPNYYDPNDFPASTEKDDYLLFIGRLISRKGLLIAVETAKAAGLTLKIAGQGVVEEAADHLITEEGLRIDLEPGVVEYVGYADVQKRAELMGRARAVLMPTTFMEPFGGVAVEAQMCGTPVISTDHAAFAETVKHGVTGYRCHTLQQFVDAVHAAPRLDPVTIRQIALHNYSIWNVRGMYEEYFTMLSDLWNEGWYSLHGGSRIGWLEKR